jgi:hypothetical protein
VLEKIAREAGEILTIPRLIKHIPQWAPTLRPIKSTAWKLVLEPAQSRRLRVEQDSVFFISLIPQRKEKKERRKNERRRK